MDSLIILVPLGLIILLASFFAFFWTVNNKQYDDIEGAAQRILLEEDQITREKK